MLVVETGIDEVSVIPLDRRVCILGKSSAADAVCDNPYVSRRHAEIVQENGGFVIRDLQSKNGTFVNGGALQSENRRLRSGDRIELGRGQVVLRFQEWGTTVTLLPAPRTSQGDLALDERAREVLIQGQKLEPPFSRKEFDVLSLLFRRRDEACSKDEIAAAGWPERVGGDVGDQDIEQYIHRIRLRIEPDPSRPQYILTVRGYGYKLSIAQSL